MHDHGLGARLRQPVERVGAVLVAADQAGDPDAGDVIPVLAEPAGHEQRTGAADRDNGDSDRRDAPEGQLAPHAAAVDY